MEHIANTQPKPSYRDFQLALAILSDIARAATSFEELLIVAAGYEQAAAEEPENATSPLTVRGLLRTVTQGFKPPSGGGFDAFDDGFARFQNTCLLLFLATSESDGWEKTRTELEWALTHPAYSEKRVDFTNALAKILVDGLEKALPAEKA